VRVKQKVVFIHVHEIVVNLSSKYKARSIRKILRFWWEFVLCRRGERDFGWWES